MSRLLADRPLEIGSVRSRLWAVGVMLALGLTACAKNDDEPTEPVEAVEEDAASANEAAAVGNEAANEAPAAGNEAAALANEAASNAAAANAANDVSPIDAELGTSEDMKPIEGPGAAETAAMDAMFNEPPLPASEPANAAAVANEAAPAASNAAAPQLSSAPPPPPSSPSYDGLPPGTIRSAGAVWKPGDVSASSKSAPAGKAAKGSKASKAGKPSAPAAAPAGGASESYKIVAGDTLYRIAAKLFGNGKRWKEIAALNKLTAPYLIHAGASLLVPAGGKTSADAAPGSGAGTHTVTVKAGDTLWTLAQKLLGSPYAWPKFLEFNTNLKDPNQLTNGMVLSFVPGASAANQTAKAAPASGSSAKSSPPASSPAANDSNAQAASVNPAIPTKLPPVPAPAKSDELPTKTAANTVSTKAGQSSVTAATAVEAVEAPAHDALIEEVFDEEDQDLE